MASEILYSEAIEAMLDGCMDDEEVRNRSARALLGLGAYIALQQVEWETINIWDLRREYWKKKGNPQTNGTYEDGWRDALSLLRTTWFGCGTLDQAVARSDKKAVERANRDFRAIRAGLFGFIVKERENRESES